jgi:predicted ribosomally synthesized peptide with nif11-like leader
MANPQLESFLAKAKSDPDLLQRLQACVNLDAIAALGRELGHGFSGIDLVRHQAEATLRLGEEELTAAAAGVELQGHLWLMRIVWA